jgi:hypothetical protein
MHRNRWDDLHNVLHGAAFVLDPEYHYMDHNANPEAIGELMEYIDKIHGEGSDAAAAAVSQYAAYKNKIGMFASETAKKSATKMRAGEWWDIYGCGCKELQIVARKCLSAPISAGAGERNWSSYGFIVDKKRNRLSSDRAKKLVYVFFNLRALRKLKIVDYESEFFQWDEGSLGLFDEEELVEEESVL